MFITCRSRRVNASLSFSFDIVMLIFQHLAPDVKRFSKSDRNVGPRGPSSLVVGVAGAKERRAPREPARAPEVAAYPASRPVPDDAAASAPDRRSIAMPAFTAAVRRTCGRRGRFATEVSEPQIGRRRARRGSAARNPLMRRGLRERGTTVSMRGARALLLRAAEP